MKDASKICGIPQKHGCDRFKCVSLISSLKINKRGAPFYGWGSTASRLEPLPGGSLLFTTKLQEIPATHFIDLGRMKG